MKYSIAILRAICVPLESLEAAESRYASMGPHVGRAFEALRVLPDLLNVIVRTSEPLQTVDDDDRMLTSICRLCEVDGHQPWCELLRFEP